jgi:hypothetical protein
LILAYSQLNGEMATRLGFWQTSRENGEGCRYRWFAAVEVGAVKNPGQTSRATTGELIVLGVGGKLKGKNMY